MKERERRKEEEKEKKWKIGEREQEDEEGEGYGGGEGCGGGGGRDGGEGGMWGREKRLIYCSCEVAIASSWAKAEWSWPHFRTTDIWHSPSHITLGKFLSSLRRKTLRWPALKSRWKSWLGHQLVILFLASGSSFPGIIFITIEIRGYHFHHAVTPGLSGSHKAFSVGSTWCIES